MNAFLQALLNPSYSFLRNALAAALLSSVLFGVLGSIVTVKRIAGLAGAISHAVLGGIGMALYLKAVKILPSITPMAGAMLFALIAALIIALVSLKAKQREDTVINAVWAIGMSVGVLFMAKTPGYTDPSSYLFGNILLVSSKDLILLAVLDVLVIILSWRFYPQLIASSFDEEFSRVRGVKTQLVFIVILVITAVSVVLLQTFVGIVMVIAMLTLPSGIASFTSKSVFSMMAGGCVFAAVFSVTGLAVSWNADLPSGAVTVVFAGIVYIGFAAGKGILKRRQAKN